MLPFLGLSRVFVVCFVITDFFFFFLNFTALAALSGGKSCNGLVYCFLSFHPCSSCNVGLMFLVS